MDKFCNSTYWDWDSLWNAEVPDFTYCFQETAINWTPCIFLWIFSPFEIYYFIQNKRNRIPWTVLNLAKFILSLTLVALSTTEMINALIQWSREYASPVAYYTPFIKLITFILGTFLIFFHRIKGIHTSLVLWFFWLLLTIGGIINYRSLLLMVFSDLEYDGVTDDLEFGIKMAYFPIIFCQFVLSCFADIHPDFFTAEKFDEQCPESYASILSKITFWWGNSLILLGYKKPLTKDDMWHLSDENKTRENVIKFEKNIISSKNEKNYKNYQQLNTINPKYNGIMIPLIKTYWIYLLYGTLLKLGMSLLTFANPILLDLLISYMSNDEPYWRGYVYAALMLIASMIESLISSQYEITVATIGMRIRSCVTSALYKKSLRLSSTGRKDFTTGEIVNLMAIDTQRIMEFVLIVNDLWSAPLQIGISIYLLWGQLGIATVASVTVMLLLIPFNGFITGRLRLIQTRVMKYKDQRIKLMNEVLNGIRVLKLYAWEQSFNEQLTRMRTKEIKRLITRAYVHTSMVFSFFCAPFLVAIASFTTFTLIDSNNILTANIAFVSLALFNQLRQPLGQFPRFISFFVFFSVSLRRINKYLSGDELDDNAITCDDEIKEPIVVEDASFGWSKDENPTLENITLKVGQNQLVAIVGHVGVGKSSLLYALLGNMVKSKGKVHINGKIAYVPQQAWIMNATLRHNIIYTNTLIKERLDKVIQDCALSPDLDILPGGDMTEIGEKGINLSGGQKQRVSMARACYSDADIYLLDDPLSALDANVGKHIFDRVIGPNGMLKNKTRILVTHRISVLPKCDQIIVMKNGRISEFGSYKELLQKKGAFAEFLINYLNEIGVDDDEINDLDLLNELSSTIDPELARHLTRSDSSGGGIRKRTISGGSSVSHKSDHEKEKELKKKEQIKSRGKGKLTMAETSETGSVKWTVYMEYFKKLGYCGVITVMASMVFSSGFNIGTSFWLSAWSDDADNPNLVNDTVWRYTRLGVYGAFGTAETIFTLVSIIIISLICLRGAKILHQEMLNHILRGPMSFFDTTPMGRILNKFSRDIDICDTILSMNIRMTLIQISRFSVAFIIIGSKTPWVLLVMIPIAVVYYFIQSFYISTSRQLRRIVSTTLSPIYTHFSETISGATSIRAYGSIEKFIEESNKRIDVNHSCYYPSLIAGRWLATRLEFLGYTIIFTNALFAVISRGSLSAGVAGLTLSYAMTITRTLNNLVQATTNLETNIVSVERCLEYTHTPTEAEWHNDKNKPNQKWPENGVIKFDKYSTRYREGLELVLKDISFQVNSSERVGIGIERTLFWIVSETPFLMPFDILRNTIVFSYHILMIIPFLSLCFSNCSICPYVGRTGAGKSSITLALFRIIEPANGTIYIDDVDIAKLGLYDLRSQLTIIPQDPVLFTGTLRLNLDPFEMHSDEQIWESLELAHLKSFVSTLEAGLSYILTEGGENLSVGQKQLVCLARALLRKSKIIVLDEATAAVDIETDELIQYTIRKEFSDCTIVTIAHRLNTIIDYDRVLVMDRGQIAEYDSPQTLLNNHNSIFYSMAKDAGLIQ